MKANWRVDGGGGGGGFGDGGKRCITINCL